LAPRGLRIRRIGSDGRADQPRSAHREAAYQRGDLFEKRGPADGCLDAILFIGRRCGRGERAHGIRNVGEISSSPGNRAFTSFD